MAFDRVRFVEIAKELETLAAREATLRGELEEMFHVAVPKTAVAAPPRPAAKGKKTAPVAKKTAPKKKGELQKLVLATMGRLTAPHTPGEILTRVQKARPTTTLVGVNTVLNQLSKRGKVIITDGKFYLPTPEGTSSAALAGVAAPRSTPDEPLED